MQLLVSDANILIDLEEGDLLTTFFELPYEFTIPDILFFEELEEQHAHLIDMGLTTKELSGSSMSYVFTLIERARGPSRNDCFALALAKQENCPLLSGDRDLRQLAEEEFIPVRGTIWVIGKMIENSLITIDQARTSYDLMKDAGRRLPWRIAENKLVELAQEL